LCSARDEVEAESVGEGLHKKGRGISVCPRSNALDTGTRKDRIRRKAEGEKQIKRRR
jgi:hypothetical protein